MRRRLLVLVLAAPVCAAVPAMAGGAAAASSCRNLPIDASVRPALERAHGHRDGHIARGSIYYGRCGSTRYAIASFSRALADQPEKFRKLAGRAWSDKGDGFENGCDAGARWPVPKALVRLWSVCPSL